jgi:hypothetical protein
MEGGQETQQYHERYNSEVRKMSGWKLPRRGREII